MTSKQLFDIRHTHRHVLISQNCLAIVLHRIAGLDAQQEEDGHKTFADFLQQNSLCFWNACLTRSVASLEYRGCLIPCTLLVCGTDFALEVIRSAWARRVLRPPKGYGITKLGDVGLLDMVPAPQTQFAPLSEALCKVVADLNGDQVPATTATLRVRLEECFPEMQVPSEEILYKTLGGLIKERKLYHTGGGYFVVSPSTYRQRAVSPLCERQMLMTNEEAIVRLHGNRKECSLAIQVDEMDIAAAWKSSNSSFLYASSKKENSTQNTKVAGSPNFQLLERSHSLKVTKKGRSKLFEERGGSFKENSSATRKFGYLTNDFGMQKNEKQSMLTKIFKRMQSLTDKPGKHVGFCTQFPPLEWLESDKILYHSVATQTQMVLQKTCSKPTSKHVEPSSSRIPWNDAKHFEGKAIPHYLSPINKRLHYTDVSHQRKSATVSLRQNNSRHSPLHRYSCGPLTNTKRRHRHRRSSSESPKIIKTMNNYNNQSTSSKSPVDHSEDQISRDSPISSIFTSSSKAISNSYCPPLPAEKLLKNNNPQVTLKELKNNHLQNDTKTLADIKNNDSKKSQMTKNMTFSPELKLLKKEKIKDKAKDLYSIHKDSDNQSVNDAKLAMSETYSEASGSGNNSEVTEKEIKIQPPVLKNLIEIPKILECKSPPKKEIIIDNSISVEVAVEKNANPKNVSTTVVTEETTVTKGKSNSKVVTVTSITTSMSNGGIKDLEQEKADPFQKNEICNEKEKFSVNNLNIENEKDSHVVDCSSSCNIVTEVK